jgi:hypothetical protein
MNIIAPVQHSFDTVELVVPTTDWYGLDDLFAQQQIFMKLNPSGEIQTTFSLYFMSKPADFPDAPSWWTPPTIKVKGSEIRFKFSLPKLWFGHSARHAGVDHLCLALQGFEHWLTEKGVGVLPWPDWQIRRIDLCYNFRMPTPELVEQACDQLARLRYRGRLAHQDRKNQYPYWPGTTRTIKFYQKGKEMFVHRNKPGNEYPEKWLENRLYNLNCVLRFEEEWRGKQLQRFVGATAEKSISKPIGYKQTKQDYNQNFFKKGGMVEQVTVSAFLARLHTYTVSDHLDFIGSKFTKRSPADGIEQVFDKIRSTLRKPKSTLDFVIAILDKGYTRVKKETKESTFYYRKKVLEDLGYDVAFFDTHFDKDTLQFDKKKNSQDKFLKRPYSIDISEYIDVKNFCVDFDFDEVCSDPLYIKVADLARQVAGDVYKIG